jgi:hypothetical protein
MAGPSPVPPKRCAASYWYDVAAISRRSFTFRPDACANGRAGIASIWRATAGRERLRVRRTAEQYDELSPFQLIEVHSVPARGRSTLQVIELAMVSQRTRQLFCNRSGGYSTSRGPLWGTNSLFVRTYRGQLFFRQQTFARDCCTSQRSHKRPYMRVRLLEIRPSTLAE